MGAQAGTVTGGAALQQRANIASAKEAVLAQRAFDRSAIAHGAWETSEKALKDTGIEMMDERLKKLLPRNIERRMKAAAVDPAVRKVLYRAGEAKAKAEALKKTVKPKLNAGNKGAAKIGVEGLKKTLQKAAPQLARGLVTQLAMKPTLPTLALAAGIWCLDSSERKFYNNLISCVPWTGGTGPGSAPALDAPPEPPRTNFLPLTHDGNRDGTIERMDKGMTQTNV
jgi:hypothetical protein